MIVHGFVLKNISQYTQCYCCMDESHNISFTDFETGSQGRYLTFASSMSSTEDSKNRKQKIYQIEMFSERMYLKTALILRETCQLKRNTPPPTSFCICCGPSLTTDLAQSKTKQTDSIKGVFHIYLDLVAKWGEDKILETRLNTHCTLTQLWGQFNTVVYFCVLHKWPKNSGGKSVVENQD